MKDLSIDPSIDPTIPDRDEFIAGGKWAGLEDDLDDLIKGIYGSPAKQRATFYDRTQALADKRDLPFGTIHDMALLRHPEMRSNEDLNPTPFVPKLKTLTEQREAEVEHQQAVEDAEKKKAAKRMARVRAALDLDAELTFGSAWEATETEGLRPATKKPVATQPEAAMGRATLVACEKSPSGEAWLIEGAMCCPIFPQE
jgi:hypothetical protein